MTISGNKIILDILFRRSSLPVELSDFTTRRPTSTSAKIRSWYPICRKYEDKLTIGLVSNLGSAYRFVLLGGEDSQASGYDRESDILLESIAICENIFK